MREQRSLVEARCPIRVGEPCSLCAPGAAGPQDCGLVHLVMQDPELRDELAQLRAEHQAEKRSRAS